MINCPSRGTLYVTGPACRTLNYFLFTTIFLS